MCCGSTTPRRLPVPRIIHQIWVGAPMPDAFAAYAARWRDIHPGWEHRLWTEPDLAQLDMFNRSVFDAADRIADHPHHAAQLRSDIARYEILHSYGGVYVDCDIVPLRPIGGLVEGVSVGMAWETEGRWLGNGVIAAAPGNPVMAAIIRGVPARVEGRDAAWRPNKITGPQYVTPIMLANRASVSLWPSATFYPVRWDNLDALHGGITAETFPGSFGVHLWANAHRRDARALPALAEVAA